MSIRFHNWDDFERSYLLLWDDADSGVTHNNLMESAAMMKYLAWVFQQLQADRQQKFAFTPVDYLSYGTRDIPRLSWFGAANPDTLLVPRCAQGHWTCYVVSTLWANIVHYDPRRMKDHRLNDPEDEIFVQVGDLLTQSAVQEFPNLADAELELAGMQNFVNHWQPPRDYINCGFFVASVLEQTMRGQTLQNFNVNAFRRHVASI
uniref:ULP_PROTEASE domain-containing protein n=1 Tax=Steinernema glaseri TaxID=37863 RepID=A0A1I8ADY2_9BILA